MTRDNFLALTSSIVFLAIFMATALLVFFGLYWANKLLYPSMTLADQGVPRFSDGSVLVAGPRVPEWVTSAYEQGVFEGQMGSRLVVRRDGNLTVCQAGSETRAFRTEGSILDWWSESTAPSAWRRPENAK